VVDYEELQPRLEALLLRHEEDLERTATLEKRVAAVVQQYAVQVCFMGASLPRRDLVLTRVFIVIQVDSLSELFVAWDEMLCAAEDRIGKLEKEREERSRHGYE
jgi:hypothetical protein